MRLKELRNNKGITQGELAKKMNVTSQTILNWESGIYEPKIIQLIELANIFDVSIDYLVERTDEQIENHIDALCRCLYKMSKEDLISTLNEDLKKITKNTSKK